MFGYVLPLKGELKVKDLNLFISYYCGLCFHLKNEFGNIPRTSVNYDMTFLSILLDSLSDDELIFEHKRCIARPIYKKYVLSKNKAIKYSAYINLALFYYKLLDDVDDNPNVKSKISVLSFSPYKKNFSKIPKNIINTISANLQKLREIETKKSFYSLDEICHPFADMVGIILKEYPYKLHSDSEELRMNLYNFGYFLGKWIYIMDAYDDLKDDFKKNNFNPIIFLYQNENEDIDTLIKNTKDSIQFFIFTCNSYCKEYLCKLPIIKNKEVLDNIINLGVVHKYESIVQKYEEKK